MRRVFLVLQLCLFMFIIISCHCVFTETLNGTKENVYVDDTEVTVGSEVELSNERMNETCHSLEKNTFDEDINPIEKIILGFATDQKIPILFLTIGCEDGQVAYSKDYALGFVGPEAIIVEDGKVFILDKCNGRVVICMNGMFSCFDILDCAQAQHMTYDNGMIGVVDTVRNVTGIYAEDGSQIALIPHPQNFVSAFPMGIREIGEKYIIWETTDERYYKYDWETESMSRIMNQGEHKEIVGNTTVITDIETEMEWVFDTKIKFMDVLRVVGEDLHYSRFDMTPGVSYFAGTQSVGVLNLDGRGVLLTIDTSEWYTSPTHPFYVSRDGKMYLMDCYENEVVISEIDWDGFMPTESASKKVDVH